MSSVEDRGDDCDSPSKKNKFVLRELQELKEIGERELFEYIETLHRMISKYAHKLHKYKNKIKKLSKKIQLSSYQDTKDKNKRTDAINLEKNPDEQITASKDCPINNDTVSTANSALDFVAEIRQAAEQAQSLSDFVYEPTSGLYYDQRSGYYYNAEYGLYYDGNTGCYYSYDQEKNVFTFHSQVAAQLKEQTKSQTTANNHNNDNTSNDNDNDDDDDDVEFDEMGGVIIDETRLMKIRKAKRKAERKQKKLKKKIMRKRKQKREKDKNCERSSKKRSSNKRTKIEKVKKKKSKNSASNSDAEDGQLDSSSTSSDSESSSSSTSSYDSNGANLSDNDGVPIFKSGSCFQDIAKKYPPSLRIIVQETNLNDLKVGSLSLITYKGGTLGREGNHDVIIPDVNVSKNHLQFTYSSETGNYMCLDSGSRNGTFLNGNRLMISTNENDNKGDKLIHGSVIQVSQTKLLCHIHDGNSTCGLCEPGLLIETVREGTVAGAVNYAGLQTLTHKQQLKQLQKKYGLENAKFLDNGSHISGSGGIGGGNYNDRAATRRIKIGSTTDKQKTQMASLDTAISSENKGFKMLSKMGWSKGDALGKTNTTGALLEPIQVSSNQGKVGLGCDDPVAHIDMTLLDQKKINAWKKVQERYQKATNIFNDSDDSDDE